MTNAPTAPTTRDVLTQAEATTRASRVSEVTYELHIDLAKGRGSYGGDVTIRFALTGAGDLFLDFTGKQLTQLEVNGRELTDVSWTGHRLTLPADALAATNVVRVAYENEFDHDGDGFHQFVDPEDGEEYLYTNFEPYSAHRLFPCFDQPDIKATYQLSVTAPSDWVLIANTRATGSAPADDGRTRHSFPVTARFSPYLFALVVGPYEEFLDQHGEIPLGFYCRRSLAKYVDIDEIWQVTKQGLDFYGEFFAYPYPFGKYDQIAVPEFNAGAMENIGAVTHYERIIYRDSPTDTQRLGRAEIFLHEMAHMWFGNLVTMRWWNDLWLNESFASYMAYLSLAEATRFTTSWQNFSSRMKAWAYAQDELVTTHPIAGEVADTDETFLNFDGITYGKGASALQQLVHAIGMDAFRDGMRRYFQRHAYGNTTLADFLAALNEGVDRDLDEWARLWLGTPSLNTLSTSWELDGDRISAMTLLQTAPDDYPTMRPHSTRIALVREAGGVLQVDAIDSQINGPSASVPAAIGKPAPVFVFPNHDDFAYARIALDDRSVEFVREQLERIDDPLLRQLIWQSLWSMVRDQKLRSTDYLELARAKVRAERDPELIETILGTMTAAVARYVPEDAKTAQAHRFFELAWEALQAERDHDLQITWARTLVGVALTENDVRLTGRLADGELTVEGLTVDQDMRWEIAARYAAFDLEGAQSRIDAETERDPSDRGQRALLRIEVSWPRAEVKAQAWERFHGDGYGSLHLTAAAMRGFQWWPQRALTRPYEEPYFEHLIEIFETRPKEFCSTYFGSLFPNRIERDVLERARTLLESVPEALQILQRSMREEMDALERAIKCREFAAS
ncbi:MAG: aminopeptidase N [Chloroflexi bacterium]|nr:aminopeptidase N [Chloroflexota bacterium]MDA1002934.1 aminopeptidase N [Chloroflexota bacterium]